MSDLADEYLWSLEGGSAAAPSAVWTGNQEAAVEGAGDAARAMFLFEGAPAGSQEFLVLSVLKHLAG